MNACMCVHCALRLASCLDTSALIIPGGFWGQEWVEYYHCLREAALEQVMFREQIAMATYIP